MKNGKKKDRAKKKAEAPFNPAFAELRDLAREMKKSQPSTKAVLSTPQPANPASHREMSDEEMFAAEVADAKPMDPVPLPPSRPAQPRAFATEDDEVLAHLDALVAGECPFDFSESDEYIEGWVHDLDPRIIKKLRKGEYTVEANLDLHGRVKEEAKPLTREFIRSSRRQGLRCVRIVHGRGLHSKDRSPVLKEALKAWLSCGWIGSQVLAFTSAPPADGGAGAVYVLLRK
ncbi:MAG: Smr/MutS family protein [Deltaproteobacteria bacterium]|nr:Smr/MutS family protein [Deltaproteobacteria bacterium]